MIKKIFSLLVIIVSLAAAESFTTKDGGDVYTFIVDRMTEEGAVYIEVTANTIRMLDDEIIIKNTGHKYQLYVKVIIEILYEHSYNTKVCSLGTDGVMIYSY